MFSLSRSRGSGGGGGSGAAKCTDSGLLGSRHRSAEEEEVLSFALQAFETSLVPVFLVGLAYWGAWQELDFIRRRSAQSGCHSYLTILTPHPHSHHPHSLTPHTHKTLTPPSYTSGMQSFSMAWLLGDRRPSAATSSSWEWTSSPP